MSLIGFQVKIGKMCNPKTGQCVKIPKLKLCKHGVAIDYVRCLKCESEKKNVTLIFRNASHIEKR